MIVSCWPGADEDALVPESMFAAEGPVPKRVGEPAPDAWNDWLRALFPRHFSSKFAVRHQEYWEWLWALEKGVRPEHSFIGIWPRGGGKTASAEAGVVAAGVRGCRKYVLYVRDTQERANDSVRNIAKLLETTNIERYYPEHADRRVGKYGSADAWRRERIATAGGLTVDAIGLDTAARGAKVDDQRPDLIVFDDIDGLHDSLQTTAKKMLTLTRSILPTRSPDCAVLGIQNMITPDSIFSQLADGRADFLSDRVVSGPHPALLDFEWEWQEDQETGTRKAVILSGTPTWSGQDREACQRDIDTFGPTSFLKECQHDVHARAEGLVLRFDSAEHLVDLNDEECRALVNMGRVFGGIDFGAWRFAFELFAVDRKGVPTVIGEVFSQRESLTQRARRMHELCDACGVFDAMGRRGMSLTIPIWGDAANPTDIMELNLAFHRGWDVDNRHVESPLRVLAVGMQGKARGPAADRWNDLLDRRAFRVRRTLGAGQRWMVGMNAGSAGTEMIGSRLLFEIGKWKYAVPKPGEPQNQNPDDDTADGADAIAASRYAIMSWWSAARPEEDQCTPEDLSGGVNLSTGKPIEARRERHDKLVAQRHNGRSHRQHVKKPRLRNTTTIRT